VGPEALILFLISSCGPHPLWARGLASIASGLTAQGGPACCRSPWHPSHGYKGCPLQPVLCCPRLMPFIYGMSGCSKPIDRLAVSLAFSGYAFALWRQLLRTPWHAKPAAFADPLSVMFAALGWIT